jgi:hypothetical protein
MLIVKLKGMVVEDCQLLTSNQEKEGMNRNKAKSLATSFSRRRVARTVMGFWLINQLTLTILLASVLIIQTVVEAFNSQLSPSSRQTTTAETVAASRPTVNRNRSFSRGSHRQRSAQDREPKCVYVDNGKGNINKIDDDDKPAIIRPMEPSLTRREFLIQPEHEQLLQPLEKEHSVPLVFSLWLGTTNADYEQYSPMSPYNIAELENAANPIYKAVVQSLWQLLCTRPDIQLLGDVEDNEVSAQEAAEANACVNFLRRRLQQVPTPQLEEEEHHQEAEALSVLHQTPILVRVEMRRLGNTTWTEWTTVFQAERIGDRYYQLAMQENAAGGDQDSFTRAALEILRDSLQLLLDIAVLAGSMNQVLEQRLRTNSMTERDKSTVSSMATEASPYTAVSSPVGGELEVFPTGIPSFFNNEDKTSNETSAGSPSSSPPGTPSHSQQPNTFDVSSLNAKRIVGISLFLLTIAVYATMLHLSRKKQRKPLEENGAVSAPDDTISLSA